MVAPNFPGDFPTWVNFPGLMSYPGQMEYGYIDVAKPYTKRYYIRYGRRYVR